jgi:beta-carotene isomerase
MTTKTALFLLLVGALPCSVTCFSTSSSHTHSARSLSLSTTSRLRSSTSNNEIDWPTQLREEAKEIADCASIVASALFKPDKKDVTAEDIVKICYTLEETSPVQRLFVSRELELRRRALEIQRYEWLAKLLKSDYDAYVATAGFLSPSRIPRLCLPNVQDVPIDKNAAGVLPAKPGLSEDGLALVADCELEDMVFQDSPLDKLLMSIFRKLVVKNTGGVTGEREGMLGLVDQARTFMLQPGQTPEVLHKMVRDCLGDLMTPVLPPFYRVFMAGIVPKLGTEYDGKQFGPWFYAPFLTSFVTPTFFGFLVGPSYPNRRKDGELGGLVVEKCKFLQESGCKGICLHQCKLPAQQFFQDELGLALTVKPNFVTQECQWSFGEEPVPPEDDPDFPKGCLVGCESRKAIAASGSTADVCN